MKYVKINFCINTIESAFIIDKQTQVYKKSQLTIRFQLFFEEIEYMPFLILNTFY